MRSIHASALAAVGSLFLASVAIADTTAKVLATPEDSGLSDQRLICKKHLETGSLVKKSKRCFTKAEWSRIEETEQRGTRRMVEDLTTKPSS